MIKHFILLLIFLSTLSNCDKKAEEETTNISKNESRTDESVTKEIQSDEDSSKNVYVAEKSGLILRKEPSKESEKLDVLPFRTKIEVNGFVMGVGSETIQNMVGDWVEIEFNGKKGYVFSGFLSSYDPLNTIREIFLCHSVMGFNIGKETSYFKLILFENNTFIKLLEDFGTAIFDEGKYTIEKDTYFINGNEKEVYYKISGILVIEADRKKFLDEPNIIQRLNKDLEDKEKKGIYEEDGESVYVCEPISQ